MPNSLSDVFTLAVGVAGFIVSAAIADFTIFGMLGLESQIGHGSIWDPQYL